MKKKLSIFCSLLLVIQMVLSLASVPVFAEGNGDPAEYTELESPAVTYNMNMDWKFTKAKEETMDKNNNPSFSLETATASVLDTNGKKFYEVDYDDSDWTTVSVPHPVNAEDSFDGVGVVDGEGGLYRGFMFYRKNITIPATDAGKKLFLEFEAVRQSVYLYVNGTMVGYYEAGIAPIGFDITDYVNVGQENVIAVATDNMGARGINNDFRWAYGTRETIPGQTPGGQSGDTFEWNTKEFNEIQGGLTGNVILYAKDKIYQTLPLYNNLKTMGNYIYGSNFDFRANSADITVEAEVRNETSEAKDITLQVDIVDGDGNKIATFEQTENVAAATDTDSDQFLTVVPETAYNADGVGQENNNVDISTVDVTKIIATENVADLKFWSDVSPNLYTVYTYLKDGEDVIDAQKTVTGFREVTYDKDKGLQINGKTTYLKGYAQRSTNEWAAIGVANDWLEDIDMQLIKESNANYIRWMHVAPKPNEIRSGDKYGVISIAPAGDKEKDVTGRQWDQRVEAMRDTIIYFRNSPSVMFWEAGNNAITAAHMKEMTDLRKAIDPEGDRRMGCRTISSQEQIAEAEWAGTMLYRHAADAYASMEATGNYIPILETEFHRNESPRRVWDDFSPPYFDYVNKWSGGRDAVNGLDMWDQTQEEFSRTMFNTGDGYSYYYNNRVGGSGQPYYSGAAMMVWSDSNMHVRNCYSENARASGRVDPVRIKKESFYAIQAAQSSTPKIHILGHWNYPKYIAGDTENGNYWYNEKEDNGSYYAETGTKLQRDPTKKTVYVIGSDGLSKVELYVNDNLVGTDTTPTDNYIYAFDNIDVTQSGKVYAKAYNEREEVVAEHEIKTVGEAATIRLTPVTGPKGLLADGSDLLYVDVEVVDAEGNVCPLDERKINFTVSDDTKATFLGGYNSGVGDRIVNHMDYVFAECGVNRVFVRSTRNAGEFTLTASAEGMQPVSITLESTSVELEGGLTESMQQSFAQGEVPAPPKPAEVPALKALGKTFTADWTEGTGNVKYVSESTKEYYNVTVNGTEVTFKDKPYKESGNLIFSEINPILASLKTAGADFTYEYKTEGELPAYIQGELPYLKIVYDDTTVEIAKGSTDIYVNGVSSTMMAQVTANSDNSALQADIGIIDRIPGVSLSRNEATKTVEITVQSGEEVEQTALMSSDVKLFAAGDMPAVLSYSDGAVTVTANQKIENANLIIAGYSDKGVLNKVSITSVTAEAGTAAAPVTIESEISKSHLVKAMIWDADMSKAMPIGNAIECKDTYKVDEVYAYDTVASINNCDEAVTNMTLSDDTSPDGTKYLKNVDYDNNGKGVCFGGLGANSKADIMWEADVRFDADGSGITPYDDGDKKLGTCIRRHGTKLAVQTGGSSYTDYCDVDPLKWYHIVLIGRFSASDAKTDMIVYEYNGSEKVFVGKYNGVNQRNLYANSNNGAQHWNVHKGTSVDNLKITMLGADKLNVTSDAAEIKAGNTLLFDYNATRQGEYIAKPDITWAIYNADNTAELNDSNISITNGVLNVGLDASAQKINVRATAANGVYGSKEIDVKAVDISDVKFDTLTLSAEKDYVSATEPLTITASATKNGQAVTLADSDLIWYATDSSDMQKLGEELKWITITNGVVTVDPKAISQDITIRAADPEDKVRGSKVIHIKSSDALEGNEDGTMDRLLTADNCEAIKENTEFVTGPDGTHAYKATAGFQTGNITETSGDVVVEMDIKFNAEGAGFQPAKNGKINTCVVYHNGKLAVQTGDGKYTSYCDVSSDKWYHITLIRKKGAYAHIIFEEYDENGERTNKQVYEDVNQRNNEAMAFININAGTSYDNLRVLTPAPDAITISTDVKTIFAGDKAQASSALFWKGLEMKNPDSSMFEYKVYDSENRYPLENGAVTIDASGLITSDAMADAQDVYIRAIAKQSGKYASTKLSVTPSDILAINQLLIDETTKSKIVGISVMKNFYYTENITFVTEVFDETGALELTSTKQMYGDALQMGENTVSLNIPLPEGFNKETDTIKVYAVTKLSETEATASDGSVSVVKTDGGAAITFVNDSTSVYDAGSDVAVLVLKATADETDVRDDDILYFDVVSNNITAKWTQTYTGDVIVKTAGKINGVLTVKSATTATE